MKAVSRDWFQVLQDGGGGSTPPTPAPNNNYVALVSFTPNSGVYLTTYNVRTATSVNTLLGAAPLADSDSVVRANLNTAYWLGLFSGKIGKVNYDGSGYNNGVFTPTGSPISFGLSNLGLLYWVDSGGNIWYSNPDGTGLNELYSGVAPDQALLACQGNRLWIANGSAVSYISALGGDTLHAFSTAPVSIRDIAADNTNVYIADANENVWYIPQGGGTWTQLTSGGAASNIGYVATDGLYTYSPQGNNLVRSSPYAGIAGQTVIGAIPPVGYGTSGIAIFQNPW